MTYMRSERGFKRGWVKNAFIFSKGLNTAMKLDNTSIAVLCVWLCHSLLTVLYLQISSQELKSIQLYLNNLLFKELFSRVMQSRNSFHF